MKNKNSINTKQKSVKAVRKNPNTLIDINGKDKTINPSVSNVGLPMLGKIPPKQGKIKLQFENYIVPDQFPEPPDQVPWQTTYPINWGTYDNDKIKNCTICAAAHMIMNWSARSSDSGKPKIISYDDVMQVYSNLSGYNSSTGNGNNDIASTDVLDCWWRTGIGGDIIKGYVSLEYQNNAQIRESVYLFGGCYISLSLPNSAKNANVWSVQTTGPSGDGAIGSWGNHVVPVIGYNPRYLFIVTMGTAKFVTWGFYQTYCIEAYAVLSEDWLNEQSGKSPTGFDMNTLNNDLNQISKI